MASNVGAKFFREFFRDSPCRMAYLLKSTETSAQNSLPKKLRHDRPKTAPSILPNLTTPVVVNNVMRFEREDRISSIKTRSERSPPSTPPRNIKKRQSNTSVVREDPSRKHRTTTGAGRTEHLNTTRQRAPQPSSRKPGGCKVCLPNDPTGFLLSEIDHVRDRILDHPESISCRQAIALAQDIRNRVDAIVLPTDSKGAEKETRVKFIGGRVESFCKIPQLKRKASEELAILCAEREKNIAQKKVLQSSLGAWFPKGDDQIEFRMAIAKLENKSNPKAGKGELLKRTTQ